MELCCCKSIRFSNCRRFVMKTQLSCESQITALLNSRWTKLWIKKTQSLPFKTVKLYWRPTLPQNFRWASRTNIVQAFLLLGSYTSEKLTPPRCSNFTAVSNKIRKLSEMLKTLSIVLVLYKQNRCWWIKAWMRWMTTSSTMRLVFIKIHLNQLLTTYKVSSRNFKKLAIATKTQRAMSP